MDINIAFLGGIASILAVLLAFYTIFINGRAIRKMLKEHGEILEKIDKSLGKIDETLKYLIEFIKIESESLRQEIKKEK